MLTSIVKLIINITPTKLFTKTIFFLFIGNTPKYSIVLSLSSFNKIFDPNIAEYEPIISSINTNPSDLSQPYALSIEEISILNDFNKSSGNDFSNSFNASDSAVSIIDGYTKKTIYIT